MHSQKHTSTKRPWKKPEVQPIELDRSISVVLTSTPPDDPYLSQSGSQDNAGGFNPYK